MTWLTTESPLIDWQQGLVTFPEQIQIASKEEADPDPLVDLPPQYQEFAKVFGEEEFKVLPPHREYNISIDLVPDAKLSPGPIYGMTDAESKALKQHIDKELATGKICPAPHPLALQKLNDVTHKNVYPLPRQDDLMAKLQHAKIFTKLDLRWGYNNVRIKKGDEWKTAFRTKYGLFEYLVMPFGLTNAPAAFQHFMNDLFRDLIDVTVVIYLDNILIFSEDPKDHPTHVREVLSRLMRNQLFCKLSKCHFHVTTVDYLGIVISPAGFSMDQKKIRRHLMANPQNNQAGPSLPRICQLPPPLHPQFQFGSLPSAQPYQKGNPLVMGQPRGSSISRVKGAEGNYNTHNKELLAIIKALEEWRIFLEATDKPVQQSGKPDALSRQLDYVDTPQEPEVMLPPEVFANTLEEELEIVTDICTKLKEDPSLEPIIKFLTEDIDNAPPLIRKAYKDYEWEEDLLWVTSKDLADLFVNHVWKLHGLPIKTVSDRGTTFTRKFLRALYQQLGIKPAFSSAYHPKSDGQTKRVNQFIEFYLRSYVAADHLDWAKWLPLVEYAYNNAKHAATGKTPFELVYGRNPVMNPSIVPANVPEADLVANTLAKEWKEAESALRMTKERMARPKGIIPEYSVGKKVWLDGKNVELRTNSNKLDPKQLGPFEVTEKISSHAYRLKLPDTLKIHDVFYVGLLSKTHESPSQPFPERPPPETIEGEEEYKVEQIIDSKQQRGKWFYLIKWKGYGPEDNSWEPEELLEHSQEEIQRFNKSQLKKACDSAKSL
ncbi:hypothetical protein RHS01_03640 [Rhizoctonia solani]|uniref:Retrotransposable element Tf2 155 kDa protein type 1 n=1 Tax=Rhizoctonia solani TaxID=456999 RepID=A0A8H7IHT7_9AGAM|nr:hypothetical protein RHS01_03640 [Rhizoctonia solani]